jgi:hypothetical protein
MYYGRSFWYDGTTGKNHEIKKNILVTGKQSKEVM